MHYSKAINPQFPLRASLLGASHQIIEQRMFVFKFKQAYQHHGGSGNEQQRKVQ